MGTRITREGAENVYKAAQAWVNAALRSDSSMFTPGEPIWSGRWLRELRERFLDKQDTSKRKFLEKLRDQLDSTTPAQVHQLMAEALYFHRLIVSTRDGSAKRRDIETVLGWSSTPVAIPEELIQGLTPGIANPGQDFHVKRPNQIGFLVEFLEQWKELGDDEQARLLEDPWAFKSFAMEREFRSKTLTGEPNSYRAQREALLHLVFPDVFEAIVSTNHKHWVAGAFAKFIEEPAEDVDRRLAQIRPEIEARYGGGDHVHYLPEVRTLWDAKYSADLWNGFVKRAQEYCNTGQLEVEEIEYKLVTGERLAAARRAVIEEAEGWTDLVKSGIGGNLVHPIQQQKFRGWIDESPNDSLFALQMLWEGDEDNPSERIDSFCATAAVPRQQWRRNADDPFIRPADGAERGAVSSVPSERVQLGVPTNRIRRAEEHCRRGGTVRVGAGLPRPVHRGVLQSWPGTAPPSRCPVGSLATCEGLG